MAALDTSASPEENRQRKALQKLLNSDCRPSLDPLNPETLNGWLDQLIEALRTDAVNFRVRDSRGSVLAGLHDHLGLILARLEDDMEGRGPFAEAHRAVLTLISKIPERAGQ